MTEENKVNEVFSDKAPEGNASEVENVKVKSEKEPNHERKTSNLKGRCRRSDSAAGMATIKEDNSKPKEIKTIKLDSVECMECLGKSDTRKDESSKRCESYKCENSCFCRSFFGAIKNFILRLFGFKTKKSSYGRKNYRGHRYNHQKKGNNYRSSRNQSR